VVTQFLKTKNSMHMNQFHSLAALLFFISVVSCNQDGKKADNQSASTSSVSPIDGSWETVSADGKITQFKMWHEGFFSLIMQDSSGKWSVAGAGSYSVDGNTYKETFHYCSVPEYVGASDWQTYELKGDTLYFKGFNKVVYADGSDKTSQFDKFEEKRVRAK
jgi:hypothetical protein